MNHLYRLTHAGVARLSEKFFAALLATSTADGGCRQRAQHRAARTALPPRPMLHAASTPAPVLLRRAARRASRRATVGARAAAYQSPAVKELRRLLAAPGIHLVRQRAQKLRRLRSHTRRDHARTTASLHA